MSDRWWDDDDSARDDPYVRSWDQRPEDDDRDEMDPLAGMRGPGGMPLPLMWDIWRGNWPPDDGPEVQ
jgi:hypothetical protein